MKPKKLAACGIFSAFALLSFMLENLFPPLFIAGGRIGIANFFVLFACAALGFWYGIAVIVVKSVLGSIFCGNISAILYSLPSGLIAYAAEASLILYAKRVSVIAASVFGGVLNACLQNATFCLITATPEYFAYIPYLALIGIAGGAIVGTALYIAVKYLPQNFFDTEKKECSY